MFLSDTSTQSVSYWLIHHPDKSQKENRSREISNKELFYQACVTNRGTESIVSFGPSETGVPGNQRDIYKTGQKDDVASGLFFLVPLLQMPGASIATSHWSTRFKPW